MSEKKTKEKKKIELNNVGFQWGEQKDNPIEEDKEGSSDFKSSLEPSLSDKIREINNAAHKDSLNNSEVTRTRNEEQAELDNAVLSLNSGRSSGIKTERDKTKSELAQALNILSENQSFQNNEQEDKEDVNVSPVNITREDIGEIPSFMKVAKKKSETNKSESSPWVTYGIPFLGVAAIISLFAVVQTKIGKNEQVPTVPVVNHENAQNALDKNPQIINVIKPSLSNANIKEQSIAIPATSLIAGVSQEAKTSAPIAGLDLVNKINNVVEKKDGSLVINDDLKVTNINPKEQVNIGGVVAVPGQTDIPTVQFISIKDSPAVENKDALSINSVVPAPGSKNLSVISLAQWPNAINLREMSKDFADIEALFPKTLYQKQDTFNGQDLLTIYDKRSIAQERFVKQNQSCYFVPSEMGGNWMGVNYFLMSYCFLNNQFIGVNMYTNAEPDVMKKVESSIKKFPYYHISSVYKGNGYNLISIEQSNAYQILEDYRIAILNNAVNKK